MYKAVDGSHIETVEPKEHYSEHINREVYFSLNVQAVWDYKYYFQDVVIKWSEAFMTRVFF